MKASPAAPLDDARFSIAGTRMSLAGPGASLFTLSSRVWTRLPPISPMIDTSAMIAGKIAWTE